MHIQVPDGYRCPLCPGHKDDHFDWSNLLKAPICEGCMYDIHNALISDKDPLAVETERLKQILGLNFSECRRLYLQEQIEYLNFEINHEEFFLKKGLSREERLMQLRAQIERYQEDIKRVKRHP